MSLGGAEATATPSRRLRRGAERAYSIEDLRTLAQRRLPRAVFDFYDGGAEAEETLRANRAAYAGHALVPRYLRDVSRVDTSTFLLGTSAAMPLAVSPTGAIGFGWPRGDIAIARAARDAGIPYTLPTSATASIERVARAAPGARLWFQAYMLRQRDFTMKLIDRAAAAGYEALVLTVDMPTGGKRERDLHNDFGLPFRFTPSNVQDFARHPRWVAMLARHGMPVLENLLGFTPDAVSTSSIASSVGKQYDPAFAWDGLEDVRRRWPGKLLVKGLLHPDDARQAADMGCDGIIVSNHGGRQLDGAIATLHALPAIARAVGNRAAVLVDGGARRGSDVVKALALGAHAVMVGRPLLYGVCAAGQPGAARALAILRDEMERTLRLCGRPAIADIGADMLAANVGQEAPAAAPGCVAAALQDA